MKRKSKHLPAIAVAFAVLFSFVFSLRYLQVFKIEELRVNGEMTYSMEKEILDWKGRSIVSLGLDKRRRRLLSSSVLQDLKFHFSKNVLDLELLYPEEGVLVMDNENHCYFWSEGLKSISSDDFPVLSKLYLPVHVGKEFMDHVNKYGITEDFEKKLKALCYAKRYSTLITSAEYDNNNFDVNGGSLTLRLEGVSANLVVKENNSEEMVLQSIALIEDEYNDSRDRLSGTVREYVLEGSTLTRRKR